MNIHDIECKGKFNSLGRFVVTVTEKDGLIRMIPYKNILAKECWNGVITHLRLIQLSHSWKMINQVECF